MKQIPILVLEYADYWLTANTLYCLAQNRLFDIHFLSRTIKSPFRFLPRIKSLSYFPKEAPDESFLAFIKQVAEKTKARVLVPTNGSSFSLVAQYKEAIQEFIGVIPVPEHWAYTTAADKGLLADFMQTNGIPTPLTLTNLADNLENKIEGFPFPVLLKPKLGASGKGSAGEPAITQFRDKTKLLEFIHAQKLETKYIVQNYIEGYVLGCNVLYKDGKLVSYTIQKGVVKAEQYAPCLGIEFIYNEEVMQVVDQLMTKLEWNGVANIDLIYDTKSNTIKILEINPRFWLTIGGSMAKANVNFPSLACMLALDKPVAQGDYKTGKYIPLVSFIKYKVTPPAGEKVPFRWKEIDVRYYFSTVLSRACYFYNKRHKAALHG